MIALPDEVRDLLAAIVDALDVPLPSVDPADERAHGRLLPTRADRVRIIAKRVLDGDALPGATEHLRRWTAETPINYAPWTPAGKDTDAAGQADAGESTEGAGPDPLLYGPGGYRCGCGKDAHSNLVPCAPEHDAKSEIVAFRSRDGRQLRCPAHAPAPSLIGLDWSPVTGLEVDGDDSRCTECGVDVLTDESTQADTCGRCRQPFDAADTRFDGRGRHADSPWCRRCVDNCHEGDAFHLCVICTREACAGGGAA